MFENFDKLKDENTNFSKNKFQQVIQGYTFVHIPNINKYENEMQKIEKNINESQLIVFYISNNFKEKTIRDYIIIGIEKALVFLHNSSLSKVQSLLDQNPKLNVCFLGETKQILEKNKIQLSNKEKNLDKNIINDINKFIEFIYPLKIKNIWSLISPCISCYLITKSHMKFNINRLEQYNNLTNNILIPKVIDKNEYVELRIIGNGSSFYCQLIYLIERGELCVIKIPYEYVMEKEKLIDREMSCYLILSNPFLCKFYGFTKGTNYVVIEYIKGRSLRDINNIKLTFDEKITIIFELICVFMELHRFGIIYRDLKPDNVLIDEHKNAILIDFDCTTTNNANEHTLDLGNITYIDPEIGKSSKRFTNKSDIYSLGKIMGNLMNQKSDDPNVNIDSIIKRCINQKAKDRPSIKDLYDEFLLTFQSKNNLVNIINNSSKKYQQNCPFLNLVTEVQANSVQNLEKRNIKQNDPEAQFYLGFIYHNGEYVTRDINKAIHYFTLAANQNEIRALFYLGLIYSDGKYVTRDINKAIHYYSLAANQNNPQAQLNLGAIYHEGKYVTRDINKAIHYYSLAANQNFPEAQFNIGAIYYSGEYVTRDINKSIHYYSLAANQNFPQAQYNIGAIYYNGEYVTRDINKAIYYYSLAANQNFPQAQYNIGAIYYNGEYVTRDINKAIHYFSLAANQNHPQAQFNLGLIYNESKYVTRYINKAIHYYSLAANQNYPQAQFNLGLIYHEGKYVTHDINKAIHYYTLAANQNLPQAQYNLGLIYYEGKYVTRDINKAIHYYSLAANQNLPEAQSNLGVIYNEGTYVTRDINKAIHYYSLAANQNYSRAQFKLGFIYHQGKYVTHDINKAIHYYSLAANQNLPQAQYNLGLIYNEGKYVTRDINKAIHYYSLAANQNYPQAQFNLGFIYYEGKYVTCDINKAIHYYTLAANQNDPSAQLALGIHYLRGNFCKKDIKKGRYYIMLSSKNGNRKANFVHGFLLHEGKNIERNISEAIHYYKEASSFNNQYAKNNLGIIYKRGYDQNKGQAGKAIVYFEEAIRQKNDYLSMYNLAHIYIYDETIKGDINKSIDLLIRSSKYFKQSTILLILALLKRYEFNLKIVNQKISDIKDITINLPSNKLHVIIQIFKSNYGTLYDFYRDKDFVYDIDLNPVLSSDLEKKTVFIPKYPNAKNISAAFYDGFGRELI